MELTPDWPPPPPPGLLFPEQHNSNTTTTPPTITASREPASKRRLAVLSTLPPFLPPGLVFLLRIPSPSIHFSSSSSSGGRGGGNVEEAREGRWLEGVERRGQKDSVLPAWIRAARTEPPSLDTPLFILPPLSLLSIVPISSLSLSLYYWNLDG